MKKLKLKDLDKVAQDLIAKVNKKEAEKAIILSFSGDLGSGKTTLTQVVCKKLGIKEKIVSPTFVIMKKYNINNGKFDKLIHIDAYRIEKVNELITLGWEEIISNKKNLVIIEWPEQIKEIIPNDSIKINLFHIDEKTRGIVF